jgi:hypothetical protein
MHAKISFGPLVLTAIAGFTVPALAAAPQRYDHGNPTVPEQLMLELVNRTRANPAAEAARFGITLNEGLFPGTIATTAKPPLAFHPKLILAARNHSQWMLTSNIFDHTGVNNSTPADRMRDAGYVFTGSFSSGENISWGGTSGTVEPISMTLARHESLFRSPTHRTNICGENFKELGLGILLGTFQGFNALMVTQNFANSDAHPDPWLLGVVFKDANDNGIYDADEGLRGVTVTPEGGTWDAVTSESGGYALPHTGAGPLNVTFSGGGLFVPFTRSVQRTGSNVKLDLVLPFSTRLDPASVPPPIEQKPEITVQHPAGSDMLTGVGGRKFGTIVKGRKSPTKTFLISNTGTTTLTLSGISRVGKNPRDFIVTAPQTTSLAPGATTTIRVTFKPTAKGNRRAVIRIQSDDADEPTFTIGVSGVGKLK